MINSKKIFGRMRELGIKQSDLAKACNIACASMNLKLNGKRPLRLEEAEIVSKELNLSSEEFGVYFFGETVAQRN